VTQVLDDTVLTLYSGVRERSQALVVPLSAEDMCVQTMPDVSPTKWHLAHTTWFWERFLLLPELEGYEEFSKEFNFLFNSYYEQVGARHPRPERGFLTRPSLDEVMAYRAHVDAGMRSLLSGDYVEKNPDAEALIRLGIAHEEQHQELLLTDIKHVLSRHPFGPAAYPAGNTSASAPALGWVEFEGGQYRFGHQGDSFAFDNESPVHEALLTPFALATRAVTNAEYLAFIDDGGYRTATLWLSDGWGRVLGEGWQAPLYWRRQEDGRWNEFTLAGEAPLNPHAPVTHISFYEAAAFAEWAGARLPEEREWELAARTASGAQGRFMDPAVAAHPAAASAGEGLVQMFGDVWEWTRSAYSPYPRYRPAAGAVGEYNGKFMSGQLVLRGGSCATAPGHVRASYRNFFPPDARWQFSGIRLAKDI
jgi:ergothioneine biosynthesis protein EgtB